MPHRVRRLPEAVEDLHEIWLTIATDSVRAADRLAARIYEAEDILGGFPEIGQARFDLAPGLRKWTIGSYLILYRVEAEAVLIVRIVHGARDLSSMFEP